MKRAGVSRISVQCSSDELNLDAKMRIRALVDNSKCSAPIQRVEARLVRVLKYRNEASATGSEIVQKSVLCTREISYIETNHKDKDFLRVLDFNLEHIFPINCDIFHFYSAV